MLNRSIDGLIYFLLYCLVAIGIWMDLMSHQWWPYQSAVQCNINLSQLCVSDDQIPMSVQIGFLSWINRFKLAEIICKVSPPKLDIRRSQTGKSNTAVWWINAVWLPINPSAFISSIKYSFSRCLFILFIILFWWLVNLIWLIICFAFNFDFNSYW